MSEFVSVFVDDDPGVSVDAVRSVVAALMPATYKAWSIDEDDYVAPGSRIVVDLSNLPSDTWWPLARKVRDAIKDQLGVGARLESEVPELTTSIVS